jgi:hypothetical protein
MISTIRDIGAAVPQYGQVSAPPTRKFAHTRRLTWRLQYDELSSRLAMWQING